MPATKTKSIFACQECGYQSPKWLGRCPECQTWNSLMEEVLERESLGPRASVPATPPLRLSDVTSFEHPRLPTGIGELDRVLGGGIVPGSVVLIGGEPGVGKSTLLLWALSAVSTHGWPVLYVTGEESLQQTKLRAQRLGVAMESCYVASETDVEAIQHLCEELKPRVAVVDSIQVLSWSALSSSPGSVSQVRECAAQLIRTAKAGNMALLLVGHITKDGTLAGPKVVEHLVDAVCTFDGEAHSGFRILRATKNRFGATSEIGVFQMTGRGLEEVRNPSELFLAERPLSSPGSMVTATLEGTRPLLVDVEALTTPAAFGSSRRRTSGVDPQRVDLLLAVLEQRAGLTGVGSHDVFVSASGGVRLYEPSADLAIALAIASSLKGRPTQPQDLALGEVGLAGEVRSILGAERCLQEARRLGFKRCLAARQQAQSLQRCGLELVGVGNLREALDQLGGHS